MSETLPDILRVELTGYSASFRYPHYVQGIHPTYEMPPPATIYGLIAAVVGDYFAPDAFRFAYHFRARAKFEDYEHLHFPPAEIDAKQRPLYLAVREAYGRADMPPAINPLVREILFEPTLTLYLDRTTLDGRDLAEAFRAPRYTVSLGRSQDLVWICDVKTVTLQQADRFYASGALLSLEDAALIGGPSYAVTMPRYIDPRRQPTWGQYAILPEQTRPPIYPDPNSAWMGGALRVWTDRDYRHPIEDDLARGVFWHTWTA